MKFGFGFGSGFEFCGYVHIVVFEEPDVLEIVCEMIISDFQIGKKVDELEAVEKMRGAWCVGGLGGWWMRMKWMRWMC